MYIGHVVKESKDLDGGGVILSAVVHGGIRGYFICKDQSTQFQRCMASQPRALVLHMQGEGVGLPSILTSVRGLVAGEDFMLGEGEKGSGLEEVSTLDGAGGGEGPARTTSTLILDCVNSTLGSPVNGSWKISDIENGWLLGLSSLSLETKNPLVLISGPCGELVVFK